MRSSARTSATAEVIPGDAKYSTVADTIRSRGVSRTGLYRLLASGDAKAIKLGRSTLVDLESLDAYLASCPPARIGASSVISSK